MATMISNILNGDIPMVLSDDIIRKLTHLSNFEMIALMIDEVVFYGNSDGFYGISSFLII